MPYISSSEASSEVLKRVCACEHLVRTFALRLEGCTYREVYINHDATSYSQEMCFLKAQVSGRVLVTVVVIQ